MKAAVGTLIAVVLVLPFIAAIADEGVGAPGLLVHPDIPAVAMQAYIAAAASLADHVPPCTIPWALLAALGKVESNHGRHAGSTLDPDGVAHPPIIGIPLDGGPGVMAISDTDGGRLDTDIRWDRAVGPMQFIPTTWSAWAVDGDGDGVRDPQDIHDAAATAAAYLCGARPGDYTLAATAQQGILVYNNSAVYVDHVLAVMADYLADTTTASDDSGGSLACPVLGPVSFVDSWHWARPGGRLHKGQDMFAALGTPLVAVADAVVLDVRRGAGLGGDIVWIQTADGAAWYYAHLLSFAPGLRVGQELGRGQLIGTTGQTGNARTTPPHLHIQWRPGGRFTADVNPYVLLDAACQSMRS